MASVSVTLVVLGLLLYLSAVECDCPDGWLTHGAKCYFFSHDGEDWPGAIAMCSIVGGQLVEIESAAEDQYLSSQVKLQGADHWIALTDVLEEGQWVWLNSKHALASTGYSHWMRGEPNNQHHDQNCGYIAAGSGRWADGTCHESRHYVCEKNSVFSHGSTRYCIVGNGGYNCAAARENGGYRIAIRADQDQPNFGSNHWLMCFLVIPCILGLSGTNAMYLMAVYYM